MARQFVAAIAICSLAALHQVLAQPAATPLPDSSTSVVMRCRDCGVISSIREIQQTREGAPTGAPSGALVGLVIYIPVGRGADESDRYAGSVGSREWQQRTTSTRYEITVRMDDGDYRLVDKYGISDLRIGDRVRLSGGQIERRGQ
jgi:outer membrane lipoprotein SlyB